MAAGRRRADVLPGNFSDFVYAKQKNRTNVRFCNTGLLYYELVEIAIICEGKHVFLIPDNARSSLSRPYSHKVSTRVPMPNKTGSGLAPYTEDTLDPSILRYYLCIYNV